MLKLLHTYDNKHASVLHDSCNDAKLGQEESKATGDDHNIGSMDKLVRIQKATWFVRFGIDNQPYADAEDG